MRVLHLIKTSEGASWALRQVRELSKLGVEVHVAAPKGGRYFDSYSHVGADVHDVQLDFDPRHVMSRGSRLRDLVSAVRPDLIHSHFVGTTLTMRLALARRSRIPRLFQVPGPLHLENAVLLRAELAFSDSLDSWMGSCKWTVQRYLQAGVAKSRVFLAYYGVDVADFAGGDPLALRRIVGLPESTSVVGMVSYFYAPKRLLGHSRGIKGHEDLIDALGYCVSDGLDVAGVFVGGAWGNAHSYESRVRAYASKVLGNRAVFLGLRSDVPDMYAGMDIAVHPSHSENVGGAVESLLSKVPTIATRVGGLPDLVIEGQTGWLVPPRSPKLIAVKIGEVLRDLDCARSVASSGRQLAEAVMDVRRTALDVKTAYETILEAR